MRQALIFLFTVSLLSGLRLEAKQNTGGTLSFGVTDKRKIITRGISKDLLLRVVKESSVRHEDFGWSVEVVRKPYMRRSLNLLYQGRKLSGAHPSQAFAWHVAERTFPNERELGVKGYPIKVRIELIDPRIEGEGADRRFGSGGIRITVGSGSEVAERA